MKISSQGGGGQGLGKGGVGKKGTYTTWEKVDHMGKGKQRMVKPQAQLDESLVDDDEDKE